MELEPKQERLTRQIELVETNNILRAIKRLLKLGGWGSRNWKRALYHALLMADVSDSDRQKIREALQLP